MRADRQRGHSSLPPLRAALAICGVMVICGIVLHHWRFTSQQSGGRAVRTGADSEPTSAPEKGDEEEERMTQEMSELRTELHRLQAERDSLQQQLQACGRQPSPEQAVAAQHTPSGELAAWEDEVEWRTPGWRVDRNMRLVRGRGGGDRSRLDPAGTCSQGKALPGVTFLTRDICQLGHIPKDASHLFVYLAQGGALDRVLYGSACMTRSENRSGLHGPAYSRTWHEATKHWFDAVLAEWGGSPEIVYSEDVREVCLEKAVTRDETWRWFPGARTAHAFRTLLTKHLQLQAPPRMYGKGKLAVTIVRRLEDRNFDEEGVAAFIRSRYGKVLEPSVVFFDNKDLHGRVLANVSALTYMEQLRVLTNTDILIAAHGAAMTNIIVMQRGSAMVELFPNNFRYYMFEELARMLHLHYFPFESPTPPDKRCTGCSGRKGSPELTDPRDFHGSKKCKKCPIRITEMDWYYLLKNAASAVWLSLSRRQSVHLFDQRRTK